MGKYQVVVINSGDNGTQCFSEPSNIINEDYYIDQITIAYPNPTKDAIYLESAREQTNVNVKLINAQGRLVKELSTLETWIFKLIIPVSDVPPGLYTIVLDSNETIIRKKISIL